jgi:hypothetical protein
MFRRMRPPRRFAAPIVLTAALTGCAAGPTSEPPRQPEPHANPPPREVEPTPGPVKPQPTEPVQANTPPQMLPVATNPAAVEKLANGTCVEVHHVACPPHVSCNPPPPSPVQCPPGK